MGVDHGRLHALVTQEFLQGPDVVAGRQKVGREGVAQRMAGRGLGDPRCPHRRVESALDPSLVKVMTPPFARAGVLREGGSGKYILPSPFARGTGVFPIQSVGEVDLSVSSL